MNAILTNEFFKKFQKEIIFALVIALLGAGYNVSEQQNTLTIDLNYNAFEARTTDVSKMMDVVLTNPTEENLINAQQNILYAYAPWANRQTGEQKNLFLDYLEACNQIIISISNGETADTTEMYRLYYLLVPDEKTTKQNVEVNSPYLWAAAVPSN